MAAAAAAAASAAGVVAASAAAAAAAAGLPLAADAALVANARTRMATSDIVDSLLCVRVTASEKH